MVFQGVDDPRLSEEFVRVLPGGSNPVTLVGVVHDHPASTYRVKRAIEELDPGVLALELPPISIPLFEGYARSSWDPPLFGGEMSAAIQTARTDTVVGIDRPTKAFFGGLLRTVIRERPSTATVRRLLSNVLSTTTHAVACRLAAVIALRTTDYPEVDAPVGHDIDWRDPPTAQARDERKQVRRSRAFMDAFGAATGTQASRLEDSAREEHMADRLRKLRREDDVVVVVGIDHLDSLTERLERDGESR